MARLTASGSFSMMRKSVAAGPHRALRLIKRKPPRPKPKLFEHLALDIKSPRSSAGAFFIS